MNDILNPKAYELLLKSLKIKNTTLSRDLGILMSSIEQKKMNIEKFENYYKEYLESISAGGANTLSKHQNNEHFLDKIMTVLINEKEALVQYQQKQKTLLTKFQQHKSQIENLEDLLENHREQKNIMIEKQIENELYEIATNQKNYVSQED